jgi:hypothetical protein
MNTADVICPSWRNAEDVDPIDAHTVIVDSLENTDQNPFLVSTKYSLKINVVGCFDCALCGRSSPLQPLR